MEHFGAHFVTREKSPIFVSMENYLFGIKIVAKLHKNHKNTPFLATILCFLCKMLYSMKFIFATFFFRSFQEIVKICNAHGMLFPSENLFVQHCKFILSSFYFVFITNLRTVSGEIKVVKKMRDDLSRWNIAVIPIFFYFLDFLLY